MFAQSPQASISGFVKDKQGAVIVGAEVSAVSSATGAKTSAQTNDSGFYSLRSLPIGDYVVTVEHPGFRRYIRQNINLTTGQALELEIPMELGAVTENVTVSAEASMLETRTSDVSQLINSKTVEDVPLGDRRSMNLINVTPAAVFVAYDAGAKPNFSLAGGRTQSQMFWIDGGTGQNMRLGIGQVDVDPPVETVQEMKVLANSYSAEYGGSAGGVIIATTKSGSNRLHGSLFEYLRNDKLDAANFFAPIVDGRKSKAPLRYNVFGGTVGGPIKRDKTFFFFAYEGSRRHEGTVRTFITPTNLERTGDFSRSGAIIYDPATTRVENGRTIRDPFPGNIIPSTRFDPVAVNLLQYYPLQNTPGGTNFRANYIRVLTRDNYTAKVDHNLTAKDKISGRYIYNSDNAENTSVFPNPAAETLTDALRHQNYWYASWTRVFTPALLNELRFTYANRINHELSKCLGGDWPTKIGLNGVPNNAFPTVNVAGVTALGAGTQERQQYPIQQYQLVNNLSWVRGKHSWKFGGEVRPSMNHEVLLTSPSGNLNFATTATGLPGSGTTGNAIASLLLGLPSAFSARQTQLLDRYSFYLAAFAQDDWAISSKLTLNIGIRWETDTPITDRNTRFNGFDTTQINPVSGTPGVVKFGGLNGYRTQPYGTDWNNFGPRFGFAWKPFTNGRTVVRGGYGIFYAHPFDAGAPASASLGYENSLALNTPDNGITAPFVLRNGVPGYSLVVPTLNDSFGAVKVGAAATTAVTFYESDRKTGYAQQFNFNIQRELGNSVVIEAGYLANLGRNLPNTNLSINQIRPELLGPNATQKDRPFPQFSNVTVLLPTIGTSNYHAGVIRLEKRYSFGLNFLTTYTYSKFLDNSNDAGSAIGNSGGPYSDFYNRRADYGPSDNDIRHRFTWTSVYELPFGPGRSHLSHGALGRVVGGWGLGSVITMQSGAGFTVTTQTNSTNAFSAGALRADVLRNPNLEASQRTLDRWFDTDAFRQPAAYRFGNQGVNLLRGDGLTVFDFSVLRNFSIRESSKLQFRAEMFNAFNHTNFLLPGRVFGASGFGQVTAAQPARRIQLGLRLVF